MKNTKDSQLFDRRAAAADARAALLKAYQAARVADGPARTARIAERALITAAREERRLERERQKQEEHACAAAEAAEMQAAADAAAITAAEARENAEKARLTRLVEDEAARKAARDLRYANRKARRG